MTVNEAIEALLIMRAKDKAVGKVDLVDADGFSVGGFRKLVFTEDDKELDRKPGDALIEVISLR